MARLSLSVLGPFQAALDGEPITDFESDKVRALLAYLAVESERPHRRETLAGLLWPERPERRARRSLNQALYNLRCAIGDRDATPPFLLATRQTLRFNGASDHQLDAATFTALLTGCETHRHRRLSVCQPCLEHLGQAVTLYRGSFLDGFSLADSPAFEEWVLLQRERFHRRVMAALGHLADAYEQRGEYEIAIRYVRRQVELDSWREEAHRGLMRLLALSGQRSAALTQYETCCAILMEELGTEPEEDTIALYERVRDGADLGDLSRGPPHNLPAFLTRFVGREAELAEIKDRLEDPGCRLLTLFGPGGIGKTRLALEAAKDQRENFEHGVYFVPLVALQSADAIAPNVAEVLDFPLYEEKTKKADHSKQQLLDYLRRKRMLLVLDNFEHLLDGVSVVTEMLRAAPDVKIAVTSRARLNAKCEHLFSVGGMAYPCADDAGVKEALSSDAVRLFLDGARRVRPDLSPTKGDLIEIARICRRVGGVPLALLLASAWMEVLSPAEIAAEIARSLDFLTAEWCDLPPRQRSMHAVFDHSWRLLNERQQELCQALSVFRGGLTREAAQAVTGASLRELRGLVSRSLMHQASTGRYAMHELLRQYAAEKLSESPTAWEKAHDRHCAHFIAALKKWETDLKSARQQAALAEMDVEIENARAAWNWAAEHGQAERIDRAIEGLCFFYLWRRRGEELRTACRVASEGLRALDSGDALRVLAKVLAFQGWFLPNEQDMALVRESLALLESPEVAGQDTRWERAFALSRIDGITRLTDREAAKPLCQEGLALFREVGDRWWVSRMLYGLGLNAWGLGKYDEARQAFGESLAIRRTLGDPRGIATSLWGLGAVAFQQGKVEESERLLRECLAIQEEIGNRDGVASGLLMLAGTPYLQGKYEEAHSLLKRSVVIREELGVPNSTAVNWLGTTKAQLGWYECARTYVQPNLARMREMDVKLEIGRACFVQGMAMLGEEEKTEAQQVLQESVDAYFSIGQRDEGSQALAVLAIASCKLGENSQAQHHLAEALQTVRDIEAYLPLMNALPAVALLLAKQDKAEQAVELYALASRYPFVANSHWFEDVVGRHIAAAAASLPPEVVEAAKARGRARDLQATVVELLDELGE